MGSVGFEEVGVYPNEKDWQEINGLPGSAPKIVHQLYKNLFTNPHAEYSSVDGWIKNWRLEVFNSLNGILSHFEKDFNVFQDLSAVFNPDLTEDLYKKTQGKVAVMETTNDTSWVETELSVDNKDLVGAARFLVLYSWTTMSQADRDKVAGGTEHENWERRMKIQDLIERNKEVLIEPYTTMLDRVSVEK